MTEVCRPGSSYQGGFWEISFHSFTHSLTPSLCGSLKNSAKHHIKHRIEQIFKNIYYEKFPSCTSVVNPALTPRHPLLCFLYAGCFWTFHKNGVTLIQYAVFVAGFFHSASSFQVLPVL